MNMMVGEFKYIVHKHINQCSSINDKVPVTHEKTIYLFVNGSAPKAGSLMQELYEEHVSEDGFLYIEYSAENTLGFANLSSHIAPPLSTPTRFTDSIILVDCLAKASAIGMLHVS